MVPYNKKTHVEFDVGWFSDQIKTELGFPPKQPTDGNAEAAQHRPDDDRRGFGCRNSRQQADHTNAPKTKLISTSFSQTAGKRSVYISAAKPQFLTGKFKTLLNYHMNDVCEILSAVSVA